MADRDIPEEMAEAGARGVVGTVFTKAFEDSHSKHIDLARAVLSAALAGRTVVELPERSEVNSHERHGTWIVDGDLEVSFEAFLHWNDGSPTVEVGGTEEWGTDALRAYCLVGLAACDFADRLASESVSPKGGETDGE